MKKIRRKLLSSQVNGSIAIRLVNKMFSEQIGRNMEVYVDDMLVKSKEELTHLDDLKEMFATLRQY